VLSRKSQWLEVPSQYSALEFCDFVPAAVRLPSVVQDDSSASTVKFPIPVEFWAAFHPDKLDDQSVSNLEQTRPWRSGNMYFSLTSSLPGAFRAPSARRTYT
jgi:hypothetical protein